MCCTLVEFVVEDKQRFVVDGTSEWIPIVSGVPHGSVLCHFLCILYTSEMLELVENLLYAYTDDSILLEVVCKPTDRPAINRDLARIMELCKEWCMILNRSKIKALVVSGSRTENPVHGDLVLSRVSINAFQNLNILGVI